jgi:hypothetical protein
LGLWHQLRSQAQVDRRRLLHGRERVVVGMVRTAAGRPARGGGQATSPDPRHRPQSGRVQHWCPGRARGSTVPACRPGVFLAAGDLAHITNPPRPAVGSAATTPRSPSRTSPTRPGSCGSGAPRPGWSRALLDIPITQRTAPIGLLLLYMQQQSFARFGSGMGQGVEVPHLSTTGR